MPKGRPRPLMKANAVQTGIVFILPYFEVIGVAEDTPVIEAAPSDDRFRRCAVAGKADAAVSGDRHLLRLRTLQKIPIVSPSRFLEKREKPGHW